MRISKLVCLTFLIPTLLLEACANELEQHYPGPPLPQKEVAVIKGTNHYFVLGDYGVNLSSVDGSRVKADQVEVLAGEHVVKVEAKSSLGVYVGAKQYQKFRFTALAEKLQLLSPLTILNRGYAICWKQPGNTIVRSSHELKKHDTVKIHLHKGTFTGTVDELD